MFFEVFKLGLGGRKVDLAFFGSILDLRSNGLFVPINENDSINT